MYTNTWIITLLHLTHSLPHGELSSIMLTCLIQVFSPFIILNNYASIKVIGDLHVYWLYWYSNRKLGQDWRAFDLDSPAVGVCTKKPTLKGISLGQCDISRKRQHSFTTNTPGKQNWKPKWSSIIACSIAVIGDKIKITSEGRPL